MSSSDFYDIVKFLLLLFQGSQQLCQGRDQSLIRFNSTADVHCCRESVIARLPFVDMIVRMDQPPITEFPSQNCNRSVSNDFVAIHVGLSSGSSLPNYQRKL